MRLLSRLLFASALAGSLLPALFGAGPRWVSSRPPWNNDGTPMAWNRNDLTYWVDTGNLNASVSNAAASSMVAAAAAIWNIQYSNLTLTQGGSLNEDVNSSNVYLGSSGPIWPADASSSNYANKPIAIIFDADGTITDTLLGSGASAPTSCRQNAVTESVDLFVQPGSMAHALIILNGRCAGAATEQMLQMQYQLMRAFGRVLGIGWSQVNDNVFTGAPSPTYQQQLHWPVMHPIDILCGIYTYQCMPNPFTLRPDDISAVRLLYGTSIYSASDGKELVGIVNFPNGTGMNGVNMVAVRQSTLGLYGTEPWETTSAVTGYIFTGNHGNPVTGIPTTFPAQQGTLAQTYKGYWLMYNVPVIGNVPWDNVYVTMQAANPLYTGAYSTGPMTTGPVLPSGTPTSSSFYVVGRSGNTFAVLTVPDAASDCTTGNDGTPTAPAPVIAGGVWSGRLCGYGHSSYGSVAVLSGRTATLEVTALDESGNASTGKAHPMLGFWHSSDATTVLPTLAANTTPFNGRLSGTTQLKPAFTTSETVKFVVADERGDGRPDFTYSARFLYANTVSPTNLGIGGGTIRILGSGFQPGNTVTVSGVAARVTSITATEIDATAPTLAALGGNITNDVTVSDLRTGGTTTITGGLVYAGANTNVLTLVSAPTGNVNVGVAATFAVRLTTAAGAAVAGSAVNFSVPVGSAVYNACSLSNCTLLTDSTGLVSASVTPSAAGAITLRAAVTSGASVSASFVAVATTHAITAVRSPEYVAAVTGAPFNPAVQLVNLGGSSSGVPVVWSVLAGDVVLSAAASNSGSDGTARVVAIGNLAPGATAQVQACAWITTCTTLPFVGVGPDALSVMPVSGDSQVVSASTSLSAVKLRVTDASGHGVAGATVGIHQAVYGWQPACPASGRCATPPLYGTASSSATSDDDGYFTLAPLQYSGTAAITRIVAATGTSGYLALSLTKEP